MLKPTHLSTTESSGLREFFGSINFFHHPIQWIKVCGIQ